MDNVIEEQNQQKRIVEKIRKMEQPFVNILFEVYILGKSLVTVASEMNYSYRNLCRKHGIALNIFEKI